MDGKYSEALKPLIERKKVLEKELNELGIVIKSITNLIGYEHIELVVTETSPNVDNQNLFNDYKIVKKANTRNTKIPSSYNSKLKLPAKLRFVLNKLKSSTVAEAVEYIVNIDKSADREKLIKGLTWVASDLKGKGELNAEKVGKAYRYSLKSNTKIEEAV
jgi:hypothetical protein